MSSQLIVEIDEAMARELEEVAPARARKRSEFVRQAIRAALDRAAEARMREAYEKQPDAKEPEYFDPAAWEAAANEGKARRGRGPR